MKALILVLISFQVNATILSQYVSTPDATSEQRFNVQGANSSYIKKSNLFDQKRTYEIGTYSLVVSKTLVSELDAVLEKIKTVDELLKKKRMSFNDLSMKSPHDSFFFVDEYRVTKESDLYPDLKKIFQKLQEQELKSFSGIKVSDDFKELMTYEKSVMKKKVAFPFSFQCKEPVAPTVCLFKDLGTLYLSPK